MASPAVVVPLVNPWRASRGTRAPGMPTPDVRSKLERECNDFQII